MIQNQCKLIIILKIVIIIMLFYSYWRSYNILHETPINQPLKEYFKDLDNKIKDKKVVCKWKLIQQ